MTDWQAIQRAKQLNLELARLKRERKKIKADGARKIRTVKVEAAAKIAAVRATAGQWISEIQAHRDAPS